MIDKWGNCPECDRSWKNGKYSFLIGIENPKLYDGISFWKCPFCHTVWDRFTGVIIDYDENK